MPATSWREETHVAVAGNGMLAWPAHNGTDDGDSDGDAGSEPGPHVSDSSASGSGRRLSTAPWTGDASASPAQPTPSAARAADPRITSWAAAQSHSLARTASLGRTGSTSFADGRPAPPARRLSQQGPTTQQEASELLNRVAWAAGPDDGAAAPNGQAGGAKPRMRMVDAAQVVKQVLKARAEGGGTEDTDSLLRNFFASSALGKAAAPGSALALPTLDSSAHPVTPRRSSAAASALPRFTAPRCALKRYG